MGNPGVFSERNNYKLLGAFILVWILINFLQSIFTGLYPDEAYYWVYSRQLQWGYFDHPPMVALFVTLGEFFGHNSFCTRLGTLLLSGGGIFFLFKALPKEIANTRFYIISFLSVILFHVYGFVATPDAALFFFTALFFYAYRLFLEKESLVRTVFLALTIGGMLYSKYHGILPVFFTFLSNPKLIFKRGAWLAVLLVVIFFSPHLYWQYENDWPTFRYHLSERVASRYRISKTTNYILGQLLVWGPLTAAPVFYRVLKMGKQDVYMRAHQFTFWGVLFFFLISSFNSAIEPHWTLVAGVSFIVLLQQLLYRANPKFVKLFVRLAVVNIVLAFILRVVLVLPDSFAAKSNNLKPIFYGRAWADSIYRYAGNTPIVFTDSYGLPALYQYYHPNTIATSFNTINYRKNHYSISGDEARLNNKKVFLYTGTKMDTADVFVVNPYVNIYLHRLDSFKAANALKIQWKDIIKTARTGEIAAVIVTIGNERTYTINGDGLFLTYTFFKTRREKQTSEKIAINEKSFPPGYKKDIELRIKFPEKAGKYRLVYSINYPPFDGSLSSSYFKVDVE